MALSIAAAAELVKAVCNDSMCRTIIRPVRLGPQGILRAFQAAGEVRNTENQIADRVLPQRMDQPRRFALLMSPTMEKLHNRLNSSPVPFSVKPKFSAATCSEMCYGIEHETTRVLKAAINRRLPSLDSVSTAYPAETDHSHTATCIQTRDRKEYILDWWMSLEVDNPIIWDLCFWKRWPSINNIAGVEFKKYQGTL